MRNRKEGRVSPPVALSGFEKSLEANCRLATEHTHTTQGKTTEKETAKKMCARRCCVPAGDLMRDRGGKQGKVQAVGG
jgi:hypothetical protein